MIKSLGQLRTASYRRILFRHDQVFKAAIQLPESERIRVVEQLPASLESATDERADAAWVAEIERRSLETKEGIVRPFRWEEVKSRARDRARGAN